MQHAQGRPSGPGFSAHSLPLGPPDARRTRRTPPRPEGSRRRQAPPCAPVRVGARQRKRRQGCTPNAKTKSRLEAGAMKRVRHDAVVPEEKRRRKVAATRSAAQFANLCYNAPGKEPPMKQQEHVAE